MNTLIFSMAANLVMSLTGVDGPAMCGPGATTAFSGTASVTGHGTAATEVAACNLAINDASTQLMTELARLRDEECLDFQGDQWVEGQGSYPTNCACTEGTGGWSCSVGASNTYACCDNP